MVPLDHWPMLDAVGRREFSHVQYSLLALLWLFFDWRTDPLLSSLPAMQPKGLRPTPLHPDGGAHEAPRRLRQGGPGQLLDLRQWWVTLQHRIIIFQYWPIIKLGWKFIFGAEKPNFGLFAQIVGHKSKWPKHAKFTQLCKFLSNDSKLATESFPDGEGKRARRRN